MASAQELAPVPLAPAPWNVKVESYFIPLSLKTLPKGVYDPLEEPCLEQGEFKGGLGMIFVMRYSDTPVGMHIYFTMLPAMDVVV